MSDLNGDNEKPNQTPPNSLAKLNEGSDKVLPEPANPASDPGSGSGGDNCPDQGPSDFSAKEDLDKAAPDAPGSAGCDGGGNCVDILMRDHVEMVD